MEFFCDGEGGQIPEHLCNIDRDPINFFVNHQDRGGMDCSNLLIFKNLGTLLVVRSTGTYIAVSAYIEHFTEGANNNT